MQRERQQRFSRGGRGGAFLCLAALCCGCQGEGRAGTPSPEPVASSATSAARAPARATRVEVAVVRPSTAELALTRPAEVEASRDASLGAALGGYVERVLVKSGDRVHKGRVLAYIDSATHSARRRQAEVELEAAKHELKRAELLKTALPTIEYDAAKTRVAAAKAGYAATLVAVGRSVIVAPFAGVVDKVFVEVGEVAPPGAPIVRLLDLQPAKVTLSVSDRDVLSFRQGMAASVSADALVAPVSGTVKRIRRAADTRTRAFEIEVEVPNKDERLLPGMIASVRLDAKIGEERVVIANDWLVTNPGGVGVFVHQAGTARYRKVEIEAIVGNRVVVKSGLAPGDELVVTGHRELAEGDALIVARKGTCCRDGRIVYDGATR